MAESQSAHRQDLERIVVEAGARDSLLGIISGCVIGLAAIAGGVFLAYNGKEIGGSIFTGIGLGSLVGVFIYGTRQRKQERERKHSQVR